MDIVFLVPPTIEKKTPDRVFGCNYAFFYQHNVFMLTPATLLQQKGHNIRITDCPVEKKSLEEALKEKADIYIFYSVFLSRRTDIVSAKRILEIYPDIKIIFCGPDPSYKPENYLFSENTFVVRGEPEVSLTDLIEKKVKKLENIKGISFLKNKKVVHNAFRPLIKNLDILPIPDRSLLPNPQRYFNAKFKKLPSTTISTSRNCAFRCYYCVPNSLSFARELEYKRWFNKKPPVVARSAKSVIKEFELIKKQGYKSVFVLDDQFIVGKERTMQILEGVKDLNLEISLLTRPDLLGDEELVKKMESAGVKHIDLGVESFSQEILDYIKKDLKVKHIHGCIKNLQKYNIDPEINVMFGSCPLETKETINNTLKELKRFKTKILHSTVCTPFPGTEFRKKALENGWTENKPYRPIDPAQDSLISYPHLSSQELVRAVRKTYKNHYFSASYILKELFLLKSFKELKNKIYTSYNLLRKII